jgi:hypothetical protein
MVKIDTYLPSTTMPIWSSLHAHVAKTILMATSTNLLPATGGNKL